MFTKARWDKSFIFNSIRLRREWLVGLPVAEHCSFTLAFKDVVVTSAISGELLSAVISVRYILGFRKDNPNVFNSLIQNWPRF
jgi:hypothetical protein